MAELIGTLTSALQIAESLLILTNKLAECVNHMRSAPQQVYEFKRETSIFSTSLRIFHEIAEELNDVESLPTDVQSVVKAIVSQAKVVQRGIQHMLYRVRNLESPSTLRSLIARFLWHLQQTPIKALRLDLNSAKLNAIMITLILDYDLHKRKIPTAATNEELDSLTRRV
jgi:hypothetical protein